MIYYVATIIAKADYIDNTNLGMVGIIITQHPDIQTSKHPTPRKENFFLSISSGNVNASGVVTCQYPQIYLKTPLFVLFDLLTTVC